MDEVNLRELIHVDSHKFSVGTTTAMHLWPNVFLTIHCPHPDFGTKKKREKLVMDLASIILRSTKKSNRH